MDKKQLKDIISQFKQSDEVTFSFVGQMKMNDGTYKVLNVKKGKGKGGSLLAELTPVDGGDSIVVGTPDSDSVLNVVVNGEMHGYASEEDVPLVVKPNPVMASTMKELFRGCKAGDSVRIVSELLPEFNGTFKISSVTPSKGRYGQFVVKMSSGSDVVEFWTYRHSGSVEKIEKV